MHSRYQRALKDLPASGLSVHLKVQVRRFFCDNPSCLRKTFAQAIPHVTVRYARKTLRLIETLRELGFTLGGEAGSHIATVLKMPCSADTFLRLIRKTTLTIHPTPTHLGVDDWAFRRNVSYGTILVDLQDHRVVICFLIVPRVAWKVGSGRILAFSSSAVIDLVTIPQEPAMGLLMQYKSLIGSICRKTSRKPWNASFVGIGRPFNRSE